MSTSQKVVDDAEKYLKMRHMMERAIRRLELEAKKALEKSEEMNRPLPERITLIAMSREKEKAASEMRIILEVIDETS